MKKSKTHGRSWWDSLSARARALHVTRLRKQAKALGRAAAAKHKTKKTKPKRKC